MQEELPLYSDKNVEGKRLKARLLTAQARWTKGDWAAARNAWNEAIKTKAAQEHYYEWAFDADEYAAALAKPQ